jgi:hypothetical protein
MPSLTRFILLSFQSFILSLTNLAKASITTASGYNSTIYSEIPLKPSTLSCHLASSNLETCSELNVSSTLAIASSLLKPDPPSSSSPPTASFFLSPPALAAGF